MSISTPSAPQTLRVGVIGLGWAGETHLKSYLNVPNVEVIAVADPVDVRREQVAATYSIPYHYADYRDLIARNDLDIVSVGTPNYLHAPSTIAALSSGKHVLCEKPLASTAADAEAMVRAASENNRVLHVAFNHRQRGDVQVLKTYIEGGGLGRIYHGKAYWMRRSGIPGMGGWFTKKETAGGGPLIDIGVHVLDMALYLMNEPEVVSISAATYSELGIRGRGGRGDLVSEGNFNVEDLATAFIRFDDGSTLLLEASWAVYGGQSDDFGVKLYGTDGGADLNVSGYTIDNTLTIYTDTAGVPAELRPHVPAGGGHQAVVNNFVNAIRSGSWSAHTGSEGLRRTQIIDACYRSALEGREISLK
jgi:predicted dehydrogenase